VQTLSLLCDSGSPESVRLAAARAIGIFIGEITSDLDTEKYQVRYGTIMYLCIMQHNEKCIQADGGG